MALKIKPEYVSVEDFKTYTGIDLYEELAEEQQPNLWLRDREDELINYVNLQSWRPISKWFHDHFYTPEQVDALREAILIHAKYVWLNGSILENSGLDPEAGQKFTPDQREAAAIAPNAIDKLKIAGILTLKMRMRF